MTRVLEGNTQSKEKLVIRIAIGRASSGGVLFQVWLSNMEVCVFSVPQKTEEP